MEFKNAEFEELDSEVLPHINYQKDDIKVAKFISDFDVSSIKLHFLIQYRKDNFNIGSAIDDSLNNSHNDYNIKSLSDDIQKMNHVLENLETISNFDPKTLEEAKKKKSIFSSLLKKIMPTEENNQTPEISPFRILRSLSDINDLVIGHLNNNANTLKNKIEDYHLLSYSYYFYRDVYYEIRKDLSLNKDSRIEMLTELISTLTSLKVQIVKYYQSYIVIFNYMEQMNEILLKSNFLETNVNLLLHNLKIQTNIKKHNLLDLGKYFDTDKYFNEFDMSFDNYQMETPVETVEEFLKNLFLCNSNRATIFIDFRNRVLGKNNVFQYNDNILVEYYDDKNHNSSVLKNLTNISSSLKVHFNEIKKFQSNGVTLENISASNNNFYNNVYANITNLTQKLYSILFQSESNFNNASNGLESKENHYAKLKKLIKFYMDVLFYIRDENKIKENITSHINLYFSEEVVIEFVRKSIFEYYHFLNEELVAISNGIKIESLFISKILPLNSHVSLLLKDVEVLKKELMLLSFKDNLKNDKYSESLNIVNEIMLELNNKINLFDELIEKSK